MNDRTFTAAQSLAITHTTPRIMIIAGPGSGKTTVLVERIQRILGMNEDPERIVVLTFTNAAAREIEERLPSRKFTLTVGDIEGNKARREEARIQLGYIGTIHGFALKMLREHGEPIGYGERISVIGADSSAALLEAKARQMGCHTQLKKLLEFRAGKGQGTKLDVTTIKSFERDLLEDGLVDFDTILKEFNRLLLDCPDAIEAIGKQYRHLNVDEAQDSSELDWSIFDGLPMLFKVFVGDPDQAIYSFRGGRVDCMISRSALPEFLTIKLEENFRSGPYICRAANALIIHNRGRLDKVTTAVRKEPDMVSVFGRADNEGHEMAMVSKEIRELLASGIAPGQIAVLARTNALAFAYQNTLGAIGLPVVMRTKSMLPRDWGFACALIEAMANPFNDTLAYFCLMAWNRAKGLQPTEAAVKAQDSKREAAARGVPLFGFGTGIAVTIGLADNLSANLVSMGVSRESCMFVAETRQELPDRATIADLALEMGSAHERVQEAAVDGIHCLTIHGAKGREFEAVFVVGMEEESMPGTRRDANVEEERRLAYVAFTRAKSRLYIASSDSRITPWGTIEPRRMSRFIGEMMS